jgi:hypothetical protein
MDKKKYYEFINTQTGNVIAHITLSSTDGLEKLEKRRLQLANTHKLNLNMIYWQDKEYPLL